MVQFSKEKAKMELLGQGLVLMLAGMGIVYTFLYSLYSGVFNKNRNAHCRMVDIQNIFRRLDDGV